MTLNELLKRLAEELDLSEELMKDLEDFVDNYLGTESQGYQDIKEYKRENPEKYKPLFRELKEKGKFKYFQKLIQPYANEGVDNLLSLVEV